MSYLVKLGQIFDIVFFRPCTSSSSWSTAFSMCILCLFVGLLSFPFALRACKQCLFVSKRKRAFFLSLSVCVWSSKNKSERERGHVVVDGRLERERKKGHFPERPFSQQVRGKNRDILDERRRFAFSSSSSQTSGRKRCWKKVCAAMLFTVLQHYDEGK